ncbi:FUSC family protein [Streptomyces sp. NPDC058655]|uniref:FUSC family protein n=1 Tax=Streptomyces sp. NPDC058655 TaxID=3346577 RepID=UPI003657D8EF
MGRRTDTKTGAPGDGNGGAHAPRSPSAPSRAAAALRTGTGIRPATARRAVRVTLAACTGFYVFRYGLDRPGAATYALFAAVSLAALSRIPGTGRQRAAQVARVLPPAVALVVVGTFLAVRTWAAVAGMLVIGFCLAFASVCGPRPAGTAPGLQLLYILPCFPPYAPDTLGDRLTGTVAGIVLLILAEAYVLPDPRVPSYRDRAADAATAAARCAAALREPPYAVPAPVGERAAAAAEALRPSHVPEAERPAAPGVRERALAHTGLAARTLLARLRALPGPLPGALPDPTGLALIRSVERAARAAAALLSDGPPAEGAGRAARALLHDRTDTADLPPPAPADRRRHAALLEVADAALVLGTAADIAVRGRRALPDADPGRFWYARTSTVRLWWVRLAGHAGPRSVHFQNAVRISLALAAARTVAGLDTLPHGFWAMLAVLSLTRTTAVQTRATVRAALIGTTVGALAAGGVLALAGEATLTYAIVLPPVMLVAFFLGPVRGVGWAQGLFTLVVALAFAQLAPTSWQLAEYRFLDVLVGSVIGLVCGLLAWPRGAHDEVGRAVARLLRACAEQITATTRGVTAGGAGGGAAGGGVAAAGVAPTGSAGGDGPAVQHALVLAEAAYAQYQGEAQRPAGPGPDWQSALMAGHHVLWGARRVRAAAEGSRPDGRADARLRAYGAWVAEGFCLAAARFDVPKGRRGAAPAPVVGGSTGADGPKPSDATLDAPPLFFTATAWLDSLTTDLTRMAAAHAVEDRLTTPAPPARTGPAGAPPAPAGPAG